MMEQEIIEPEWAAPMVLMGKKDGSMRFCMCGLPLSLNSVSRADAYPMPRIEELFDQLVKGKYLTTLDLTRCYWLIPVATADQHKTTFVTL